LDFLKDYAEHASVQGLIYLTFPYQTLLGKAYWIFTLLFMLSLGIYWSVILYRDWRGQQVLTTIATTALPVNQIEFPAITFCSPGGGDFINILRAAFSYKSFLCSFYLSTNSLAL
jgi:hypothetical protein